MQLNSLFVVLADATAPAPAGAGGAPQPNFFNSQFIFLGLMVVIFYFILIRPQQKRAKEQRKLLEGLKSGDKVVTSSGILGEVITVKDRSVTLRSSDAKFEVTKESVAAITETKS